MPVITASTVIIDCLTIRDGRLSVITPLAGEPIDTGLPTIGLKDIGCSKAGASAGDVFEQVVAKVTESASKVAGVSLADLENRAKAKATETVQETVGGLKEKT